MSRISLASYFCVSIVLFFLFSFSASPATGAIIDIKPCYVCANCVPDENGNIQYDENGELILEEGEETPTIEQCSEAPAINLCSQGLTSVAVLAEDSDFDGITSASATFQITAIDDSSYPAANSVRWSLEDVNLDGMLDVVFHFITQNLAPEGGVTGRQSMGAFLQGTAGLMSIEGSDNATFFSKGCEKGPKGQNNVNGKQKGHTK